MTTTYLLVELADVVVGLVLCLDDGGVLFYVLRGRHLVPTRRRKFARVG